MATAQKNLSYYDPGDIPSACHLKFGIVVSEWNPDITFAKEDDMVVKHVPGTFELTLGAQWLAESEEFDAIICLGCVIQGETRHFDYICQGVTQGITQLNLVYSIPVVFGVLTTNTIEQARDRAGGKHGNKGDEAAITAIKMAALKKELE
jgi:6,7-dimethyl-8-ribityllumazine synthase